MSRTWNKSMSGPQGGFYTNRRAGGAYRQFAVAVLCLVLPACGFSFGGGGSSKISDRNAMVQELTALEQALAAERNRADAAEKSALRAREEANWILQTAQEGPKTVARNQELEQEVAQLRRANAALLNDSADAAALRNRIAELETRNSAPAEVSRTPQVVDLGIERQSISEPEESAEGTENTGVIRAGNYGLHLASYRSSDQLGDGWQHYRTLYPELLGELVAITVVLDVSGLGGAYHRLIAGPVADEATASGMCAALKARQEYCVVSEFDAAGDRVE